ncbi:pyrroline-5-carboxylate reductase 1, mitochondrial-like isoform X1 [Amphiura filiformis]|uniref:pyrroline-5-carboxylate reductase 1, mitochondrial-like isoform X1 n=1 Tax=Amphiura filiformis TaxID=82378 RepID=UPI003B22448C
MAAKAVATSGVNLAMQNMMPQIGFLGAGKFAQSIAKGWMKSGKIPPQMMMASAPSERNLKLLKAMGVRCTNNNKELVETCDVVLLAVKPHMIPTLLKEVGTHINEDHLVVSLAAGITIDFIESKLPVGARVVRAMPNTPCVINEGASVYSTGTSVKERDGPLVQTLFNTLGYCLEGDESMIDAVMAVSGSGPAYAFVAIDALADGGVKMGLPRDIAIKLAAQTLMGSAKLVLESGKHPSELKDDVCSPGGTTIEAIHQLERGGFRKCLIEAVEAACLKARTLNEMSAFSRK